MQADESGAVSCWLTAIILDIEQSVFVSASSVSESSRRNGSLPLFVTTSKLLFVKCAWHRACNTGAVRRTEESADWYNYENHLSIRALGSSRHKNCVVRIIAAESALLRRRFCSAFGPGDAGNDSASDKTDVRRADGPDRPRLVLWRAIPGPDDRQRRNLRHEQTHRGASLAPVWRRRPGDEPGEQPFGRGPDQRSRPLCWRPDHRPLARGGAATRYGRGRRDAGAGGTG